MVRVQNRYSPPVVGENVTRPGDGRHASRRELRAGAENLNETARADFLVGTATLRRSTIEAAVIEMIRIGLWQTRERGQQTAGGAGRHRLGDGAPRTLPEMWLIGRVVPPNVGGAGVGSST